MLDPTTDPHPGKIDLTQKHQAHPENLETPTLTQLFELPKFSQLTHFPGWAAHYERAAKGPTDNLIRTQMIKAELAEIHVMESEHQFQTTEELKYVPKV